MGSNVSETYVILIKRGNIDKYIGSIMACEGDYLLQASEINYATMFDYIKTKIGYRVVFKPRQFRYFVAAGKKVSDEERDKYNIMSHFLYYLYKDKGNTSQYFQYILSTIYSGFISPLPFKQFDSLRTMDDVNEAPRNQVLYYIINNDKYTSTIDSKNLNVDHCFFMSFLYAWIFYSRGMNIITKVMVTQSTRTKTLYTINGTHFWFEGNSIYYALQYDLTTDNVSKSVINFTNFFDYSMEVCSIYYLTYVELLSSLSNGIDHFMYYMKYVYANHIISDEDYEKYKKDSDQIIKYDLTLK
jgi:hypothetical protein